MKLYINIIAGEISHRVMCDKSTVIYRILHCIVYVEHAYHIHDFTVSYMVQ